LSAVFLPLPALLEPGLVEALAARAPTDTGAPELVDAATVARAIGVDRSWIYAHAEELGAITLGDSARPRIRFDLKRAREALAQRAKQPESGPPKSRSVKRAACSTRQILPIKNRKNR
jgi:hypothetical protein